MKYTGITIGPIYKTLQNAKKTRELWAASYLFSFLMKQILIRLKKKKVEIILPFTDELEIDEQKVDIIKDKYEAGLFPDRIIFDSEIIDFEELNTIIGEEITGVVTKLIEQLNFTHSNEKTVAENYFQKYFQVYSLESEFREGTLKRDITKSLFGSLDILELQNRFEPIEQKNYIQQFLSMSSFKNGKKHSFLIQDSKTIDGNENVKFQSLFEISAIELIEKLDKKYKEDFYQKIGSDLLTDEESIVDPLKENNNTKEFFKTYHKYIAIVHIDGDRFGEINKTLEDKDFIEFSKNLAKFSLRIQKAVCDYGGLPVYIGGDDVLFFAPVRNKQTNIFQLLDGADEIFNEEFKKIIEKEKGKGKAGIVPSLSAGISISYYKHPLEEALVTSRDLLNEKAKKYKNKNAVSFKVQMHSGQSFETVFTKNNNIGSPYTQFKGLIGNNIKNEQFLSSVSQKLRENHILLKEIAQKPERLKAFRNNFFNEDVHADQKNKDFLDSIEKYIPAIYKEGAGAEKQIREKLYASLRMVKFLNRIDNE